MEDITDEFGLCLNGLVRRIGFTVAGKRSHLNKKIHKCPVDSLLNNNLH